jgi:cis-3-alkyl-4-acyloxetan-2-one decarboxylase
MCRTPLLGGFLLQDANAFLRVALRRCTVNRLSREVRAGYLLPYRRRTRRASIRAFVEDIPLSPKDRAFDELLEIERSLPSFAKTPVLLIWGERDFCFHPGFRRGFEQRLPHAEVVKLEHAGHWWPEDQAEEGVRALSDFLQRAHAR